MHKLNVERVEMMRLSLLQLLIILIAGIVLTSISFKYAYAHPVLLESQPANLARLANAPTEVKMRFSEAVEIGFSRVEVLDSSGKRVDNNDLAYDGSELSLKVTLGQLKDDIYTVKIRVLSKVDGHVVDYTTLFAVGNVELKVEDTTILSSKEIVLLPESIARFPGMVGQSIAVGSGIAGVLLLATRQSGYIIANMHDSRLRMLLMIAAIAVIASSIAMIGVNTVRLESSIVDVLTNRYGNIALVRLGLALILLAVLASKSRYTIYASIAIGASLIATNSLLSHSAGLAEPVLPTIADFVHNIVASIWVGGLLYMAYTLLPSSRAEAPIALIAIPRFSSMIVVCLAIASITGTLMLFAIESNTATLLKSTYGMLLAIKLGIVGVMVGFGAYNQLLHRKGMGRDMVIAREAGGEGMAKTTTVSTSTFKVFARSVKVESIIGLALMLVVSMMVNTVPPEGESIKLLAIATGTGDTPNRLTGYWLDDQTRIVLSIEPAMLGENRFDMMLTAPDGSALSDVSTVKVKVSMPREGIAPVEYQAVSMGDGRYTGSITFPIYGRWTVEVLASREGALNIAVPLEFNIKPRLDDLEMEVVEYKMPASDAKPYHLLVDGRMLWISDVGKPRVWLFNMDSKEFKEYRIDGDSVNLVTILSKDPNGRVWFVDPSSSKFGYIARDGSHKLYDAPDGARLSYIMVDSKGMVWLALLDRDAVASFNARDQTFKVYTLPSKESFPIALLEDDQGSIWVAESIAGKIAKIEPESEPESKSESMSMVVKEYMPEEPLKEPTALLLDGNGNIWIAEHLGNRVVMFNPILERFTAYNANDSKSLPFGLAEDRYGNIWFAQHVVPKIGLLDPSTGKVRDVEIPTSNPFNQWLTIDDSNNTVWFAEPEGNKIGSIAIKARPSLASPVGGQVQVDGKGREDKEGTMFRLVDAATPILTSIIVIASLLFAKGVNDYRRVKDMLRENY